MTKIPIEYSEARRLNIIGKVYDLWRESVPHLSHMTCCNIEEQWRSDSVRLMIPQDDYNWLLIEISDKAM